MWRVVTTFSIRAAAPRVSHEWRLCASSSSSHKPKPLHTPLRRPPPATPPPRRTSPASSIDTGHRATSYRYAYQPLNYITNWAARILYPINTDTNYAWSSGNAKHVFVFAHLKHERVFQFYGTVTHYKEQFIHQFILLKKKIRTNIYPLLICLITQNYILFQVLTITIMSKLQC